MRQAHATIERELADAGFGTDQDGRPDVMRRARIASAIVGTGAFFGQREAARLRAHFAQGFVGLAALEAIEAALLDGSWREIDAQVRETERAAAADPNAALEPSGIQHVTAANPYGWKNPAALRADDHNVPGKWNAYRQARNLTESERREAGAPDHRVRGCTRWHVLGNTRAPTVAHDPIAVAAAQGKGAIDSGPERRAYGEASA